MWKNDIRAPSVPTLRPLPSRTALLSSSMTNCVTTAMAKLRSGKMTRGMANFESTVVRSETGSDFQNRMLRARRLAVPAVWRAPRSQHPVLEVAASFRPHHRALEVRHSSRHFAAPQLRHRRCHAVRHAAAEQRCPSGQRPECRDARGTDVVLPHVLDAPLPHADRSWPLVRAPLRLVAAGFSSGATRAVYMGVLASVRDLGSREDCVQYFAFPRHAAVPLDRAGAFHHHSAQRKPDGNDFSAHSGAIFQYARSVGRAGSRRDIPRHCGAATAVPRTNLIRMLA